MFPNDPPTSYPIILKCWFWSKPAKSWQQGQITEASAATQTARVIQQGTIFEQVVNFANIRNVCLSFGYTGQVIESFGSPRVNRPQSIPYITESLPCPH